jgi:hypothetical protein
MIDKSVVVLLCPVSWCGPNKLLRGCLDAWVSRSVLSDSSAMPPLEALWFCIDTLSSFLSRVA